MMTGTIFLKLGGSLLTDKTRVEAIRPDTVARLAEEIAAARAETPQARLVLGHGSGSFGHVAAAESGTRQGVRTRTEWQGFAGVSDAAARLNRLVVAGLIAAGVPAISLQPSASTICEDGTIISMAADTVSMALQAGLVPVLYGDVAFDLVRGGTIVSTEEVLMFLAHSLQPDWFLLAGETGGVLDEHGRVVPLITAETFDAIASALGGSRGTDVTGGMASKVHAMLSWVDTCPAARVRIFSGLEPGLLGQLLVYPELSAGTEIRCAEVQS